jgi:hypothetical protein
MSDVIVLYRYAGEKLISRMRKELSVLCARLTNTDDVSVQFIQTDSPETSPNNFVVYVRLDCAHLADNSQRDAKAVRDLVLLVIESFDVFILVDGPYSEVRVSLSYQHGDEVWAKGTSTDLPLTVMRSCPLTSGLGEYVAGLARAAA